MLNKLFRVKKKMTNHLTHFYQADIALIPKQDKVQENKLWPNHIYK